MSVTFKVKTVTSRVLKHGVQVFRMTIMIVAALVAVSIVTTLTIDLGPSVRRRLEREGTSYLRRPLHIGGLHFRLYTGRFQIDDLVIDGLNPGDRPFLRAKRITVSLSWSALINREVLLDSVEMTDWEMLAERFADGRHNFPRLTRESTGPRRLTTTLSYVRAHRGQFTYEDHGAPWSTIARNLDITVGKGTDYRGHANFKGGTVKIGDHLPMWAHMQAQFRLDGPKVIVEKLDLQTDGAVSAITGHVDLARWPEQIWSVNSRVQFPRMREIFFRNEPWVLSGDGRFAGTFHLFRGGRELKGTFESPLLGVYDYRFPNLKGTLVWLPDRFEVTNASADVYGGRSKFSYSMAPLGRRAAGRARFDATYEHVDLSQFTDFLETRGLRLAGSWSGRNLLEWPLGRFSEHRGDGEMTVSPPPGTAVFDGDLRGALAAGAGAPAPDFEAPLGYLPIAGNVTYTFGPEWVEIESGTLSTLRTLMRFDGRTAYGLDSRIRFQVTSGDWQESDRVLAGFMTAFGAPARPVEIGGRGHFEGVMLGAFQSPRIEGRFTGERMRAFDVVWGDGSAELVFENRYLDVSKAVMTNESARIEADGRFSIGYPRRDGGEEWNARFRVTDVPIVELRHAFGIDDYAIDGRLAGEFHLYGNYQAPFGFGAMTIENGVAYGEVFEHGTAALRFEGQGVRLDGVTLQKGGGTFTGAAYVGWNGTYSFNGDGRRLPIESFAPVARAGIPLTGLLQVSANGTGSFENPRNEFKVRVDDLFLADEGVGQITGRVAMRGSQLTMELDAASPRLAVSGTGRVTLTAARDVDVTLKFSETSLDPFIRPYLPGLSPFTTAIGSGTIRVVGELSRQERLLIDGSIDRLRLRLFDYVLQNSAPIRLALDGNVIRLNEAHFVGQDTTLVVSGTADLSLRQIGGAASGTANLGILQGFFRDIRSSGQAELSAQIRGPLEAPVFSGSASIRDGRIRHFSLPRSLESINGRILFDPRGARVDGLTAKVGEGEVQFGGRVTFDGYAPSEVNLTASGQNMRLRYPEGVSSIVDAELALTGRVTAPTLSGTVTVRSAVWEGALDSSTMLNLRNAFERSSEPAPPAVPARSTFPVQFDVRLVVPGTFEVNSNAARMVMSVDVTLRGTYDRPLLFGQGEILRGQVNFEGRRYVITRGRLDFANPVRIDPFFDVEAETNVRQPGQTYRVDLRATGTRRSLDFEFSSDPPLPEVDVIAMLFGDVQTSQDAELRALQRPDLSEQELVKARLARLIGSPIFSEVGRVVEQTFGVDTFQITPLVGTDPLQQSSRINPAARVTIGKRISDRVYMTYARSLSASSRDQIILIEFDQTDRFSWVFTRNEDETYSLDIRVRHAF
jgi:hypothetical protein